LKKEDYGRVPEYLSKVKAEIKRENDMIDKYVKEQLGEVEREPERFDEISEHEKQDLIVALKAKWDHTNAQYQKMTHLVKLDTAGQIRRKEHLENELKQLEAHIERLSRAGALLIKNA
jgi:signal recognition particle GTPase